MSYSTKREELAAKNQQVRKRAIKWWESLTGPAQRILWEQYYPEYLAAGLAHTIATGRCCEYMYKAEGNQ